MKSPVGWSASLAHQRKQVIGEVAGHVEILKKSFRHRVVIEVAVENVQRAVVLLML